MKDDEIQLRKEIECIVAKLKNKDAYPNYPYPQFVIIDVGILLGKIASLADIVSKRNELISRRLLWMTAFLLFFTVALFVVEVRAVFFPKNSSATIHTEQTGQHDDVVRPSLTKGQNP